MAQLGIPIEVSEAQISIEKTLGAAIDLCAKVAGLEGKQVETDLKLDKAQWSRWKSGGEGIVWPKLVAVMDHCGNDAPLLWMNHFRGYDLATLRKRQTEIERRLHAVEEENRALRRVLLGAAA